MNLKNKKTRITIISLTVVFLVCLLTFWLNTYGFPRGKYKIDEVGSSVCTMDVPSSSCGGYTVRFVAWDGTKINYTVPGYYTDEGRERYDKTSAKISDAKERNIRVNLDVSIEGEIISVQ